MNPTLKTLIEGIKERAATVEKLMAEPTPDNIAKVQELQAQTETDMKTIDGFRQAEAAKLKADEFLKSPVNTVSHGGAKVQDIKPAGETFIGSENGKAFMESYGEGLLEDKTFRAICENDYKDAFRSYIKKGQSGIGATELKILQEGADGSGGFAVPVDFVMRLIQKAPTPIRVADRVTTLTTGRDIVNIPSVNYTTDDLYTTGIRATWSGEIPATAASIKATDPTFGLKQISVYTAMLSLPLTNNMVEDAAFPVMQYVEDKFYETIQLLKENMVLNGTGIGQPTGILANPGGTVGGQTQPAVVNMGNPITADGVVSLPWNLPEQYDNGACWVFNKTSTGQTIAKLKDSNNRYLWANYLESGLSSPAGGQGGQSAPIKDRSLEGYPVLFQGFMPNVGANNFPVIFGDLAGYYLVNRLGFSIQVLREVYAETNQIMLVGRVRFGGQVCEDFRIKVGKQA